MRVSELAARLANQPRVGRQAGKPDHGPVSTAIGTKDYLPHISHMAKKSQSNS